MNVLRAVQPGVEPVHAAALFGVAKAMLLDAAKLLDEARGRFDRDDRKGLPRRPRGLT
jgi:hypothetical protein